MFWKMSRHLAAAMFAAAGLTAAAQAQTPVYVNQSSSPVYWGSTGVQAVMILRYDNSASVPLTVTNLQISDDAGNNITAALYNCGNPVKSGDNFVGHQLMPGQDCFLTANAGPNSILGMATLSDATGSATNIQTYVRTMLEIRDGNGNVLSHVEIH
jgi:hypothetical protein